MRHAPSPCILLLGGSFDPVHQAHVALAHHFIRLLQPDRLLLIPAGNPWQKNGLQAGAQHRIAMLERAFADCPVPVAIDQREIQHAQPTYSVQTLQAIRAEQGPDTSLCFLIGSDQLQRLQTWWHWRDLFLYANICAASRPGFATGATHVPDTVTTELTHRATTPECIRQSPCGRALIAQDLALDISATGIRTALQKGQRPIPQLPPGVLDYIEQHHLYQPCPH